MIARRNHKQGEHIIFLDKASLNWVVLCQESIVKDSQKNMRPLSKATVLEQRDGEAVTK